MPCVISGYLNVSSDKRNWQPRFVSIHDNFVMYSFKAHLVCLLLAVLKQVQIIC